MLNYEMSSSSCVDLSVLILIPKNWGKNSSEGKMYKGMNLSKVTIQRIIHVYSRERGITISPLTEKMLFRTQYKRGSGSRKCRMELINGVRMEGALVNKCIILVF